jgi:hypothetical protein
MQTTTQKKQANNSEGDFSQLLKVLYNIDDMPYMFYGIYSCLGLSISINGNLRIQLSKALDANDRSRPTEGVPKYDHENKAIFSLNSNECFHILNNINQILDGSYQDPDPKCDPKYKNVFKITHYPENGTSRLLLQKDKESDNLKVSIITSGNEMISFILNYNKERARYDRSIFLSVVENVAKNGAFETVLFKSLVRLLRSSVPRSGNSNNSYNSYQSKKDTRDSQYDRTSTAVAPKESETMEYSNGSSVDDIDDIPF